MIRRTWPRALPLGGMLLVCVILGLAAIRGPSAWSPPDDAGALERLAAEAPPPGIVEPELPPPGSFDIVRARNLFSVTRSPPAPSAGTTESAPQARAGSLALAGVLLADGVAIAILQESPAGRMVHLAVGESHGGWELAEVRADAAVLRRGAETLTLEIESYGAAPQAGPTGPGKTPARRGGTLFQPRRGDTAGNPVRAARPSLFERQEEERALEQARRRRETMPDQGDGDGTR